MSIYKYFTIPFECVPEDPSYKVWFATWSTERPAVVPGVPPPLVVGVTPAEELPPGATLLSSGSKDPPPPPPPPPLAAVSLTDYQQVVGQSLALDRGEDE